ncbi:hypothetical protein EDB85DRAFT_2277456 [Lactarius pseudohatsudake]|nr:hypothetical protein EDB85DRAFT_2277456 [Lactarius pseudohatsudake]
MNRKKTRTGPDHNRLQPDLRLRFIRPENFTGCGSSQFGKWVNRYRAGWDRSQPVFTATDQPRPSDNANFDNADQMGTTTTLPIPRPTAATPTSIPRTGLNNDNLKTTTRHHQRPTSGNNHDHQHRVDNHNHNCTNNLANNTSTTTATIKTITHRQPQGRHIDNGNTSTAATSTNRQRRRSAATTTRRQRRRRHIDSRNNNTTTAATSTQRQPPAATSSHQQP